MSIVYSEWEKIAYMRLDDPPTVDDYQCRIPIDYLHGMNSDFSDIRFTDLYGRALKHNIFDKTDATDAEIDVLLPNQDIGVRMYYGNPSATDGSDPHNVYLQYHGEATSDYMDSAVVSPSNIIFETRVKMNTAGYIYWGIGNTTDRNSGDHLLVGNYNANNKVYKFTVNNGSYTYNSETPPMSVGTYRMVKFIEDSSTFQGYIEDNPISTSLTTTANDDCGLQAITYSGGTFIQDFSLVRKYLSTEPTASIVSIAPNLYNSSNHKYIPQSAPVTGASQNMMFWHNF